MNNFNSRQEPVELHAIVWGRVQGVGFRMTARHYALQLDLTGTVRNLEDGNVEIVAQGPRQKMEQFIQLIKEHFGSGYIARLDTHYQKPSQSFEQFKIL